MDEIDYIPSSLFCFVAVWPPHLFAACCAPTILAYSDGVDIMTLHTREEKIESSIERGKLTGQLLDDSDRKERRDNDGTEKCIYVVNESNRSTHHEIDPMLHIATSNCTVKTSR
jgi:hypothetical protein